MTTYGAAAETKGSIYEREARSRKVLRLCLSIDGGLSLLKVDPFSAQALEYVLAMTDAAWGLAASHAIVLMPSATTRTQVEDIYRRRVEIRGCLSRLA